MVSEEETCLMARVDPLITTHKNYRMRPWAKWFFWIVFTPILIPIWLFGKLFDLCHDLIFEEV
jgi:hypothetical protein